MEAINQPTTGQLITGIITRDNLIRNITALREQLMTKEGLKLRAEKLEACTNAMWEAVRDSSDTEKLISAYVDFGAAMYSYAYAEGAVDAQEGKVES